MTMKSMIRRLRAGSAVLTVALLAACVPPATRPDPVVAASPCADPSYGRLQQQHPDSLSAREWQRLQTLDRDCSAARAQGSRQASGMTGRDPGHGGSHMMGAGIVATVIMLAMMISMW